MNPLVEKYREQREREKAEFFEKMTTFFAKNKKSDVALDYAPPDYKLEKPEDMTKYQKFSEDEPGGLNNPKGGTEVKKEKDKKNDNADLEGTQLAATPVEQGKDEEKKRNSPDEQRGKPVDIINNLLKSLPEQ
jgi:hypothetical protein